MIKTIYIEEEIREHPRTIEICQRFPKAVRIPIQRYGEVFNRKAQNFRLQKKNPALILAKKFNHFVLDTPRDYGIGGARNFYFSHMLNCVYDCRYCFLQGMYRSAHYVLFLNFEDFQSAIEEEIRKSAGEDTYFFSGYDCDSLALESVTGFVDYFLPFFKEQSSAWIELRTKSTQIRNLLKREPFERCIVAFSLTPEDVSAALEHKAPSLDRRLDAMLELQENGWKLGLRFDPLIYHEDYKQQYLELYEKVFENLRTESIHSVSVGPFRLPKVMYEKIFRLYPEEKLFAGPLEERKGMVSYPGNIEEEMVLFCTQSLLNYIPKEILYPFTLASRNATSFSNA